MDRFIPQGLGWIPDLPDPRDYTFRHKKIKPLLSKLNWQDGNSNPDVVDLRTGAEGECYFSTPDAQGAINSSTAFAVLSLVEYFERRIHGRVFNASKLFLYKVTRNLRNKQSNISGDTGADLRTTLKALCRFGVPDEEHWPYDPGRFDEEPSSFIYHLARRMTKIRYFRIDAAQRHSSDEFADDQWVLLRSFLAAGFPVAFGLAVPSSLTGDPKIHYRAGFDHFRGGHTVIAIGYKHNLFGRGQHALLIRNSWGSSWGDNGNGWLPLAFLQKHLARDFWTIVCNDWLKAGELTRPTVVETRRKKRQ